MTSTPAKPVVYLSSTQLKGIAKGEIAWKYPYLPYSLVQEGLFDTPVYLEPPKGNPFKGTTLEDAWEDGYQGKPRRCFPSSSRGRAYAAGKAAKEAEESK